MRGSPAGPVSPDRGPLLILGGAPVDRNLI